MLSGITNVIRKQGFKKALANCLFILRYSLALVKKNRNILTPAIQTWIYSFVLRLMCIVLFYQFVLSPLPITKGMVVTLLFIIFILFPYRFFFDVRQQAKEVLMVFNEVQSKTISFNTLGKVLHPVGGKLRLIAIMNFLLTVSRPSRQGRKGFLSFIYMLLFSMLEGIWDLAEHYLLPAVVIDQLSLSEATKKIKALKDHLPETLVGVFGIGFSGIILAALGRSIYFVFLVVGIALGYFFPDYFPLHNLSKHGHIILNYFPIYIFLSIAILINSVIVPVYDFIKNIYFTIFFILVDRPETLSPETKENLTDFVVRAT